MMGFGLAIGLVFPPFCLLLGLPETRVLTPLFYLSPSFGGADTGGLYPPLKLTFARA